MFYPGKVAFRVGSVSNTQWDNVNVGNYSVAMGRNTTASGPASTTMGLQTTASGQSSTAMGVQTTASGNNSTAMGLLTIASGIISTAMGLETTASGDYSTAMGNSTTASGNNSTAMGFATTASGNNSTAIGSYVSTNNVDGCLIIGDHSTTTVMNSGSVNGFRARFAGGYRFYTSSNLTTNAYLAAGDNAWSTSSSVHFKRELPGRSVCRHIILILWMKLIV